MPRIRIELSPEEQGAVAGLVNTYLRVRKSVQSAGALGEDLGRALEIITRAFGHGPRQARRGRGAAHQAACQAGTCQRCRGSGLARLRSGRAVVCPCVAATDARRRRRQEP